MLRYVSTAIRPLIFHLLSLSTLFVLSSCDSERTVDRNTKEKILLLGNNSEPTDLDPQAITGVVEMNIVSSLFEGLCVQHPSKEGVHLPGVAESWKASQDFKTWTFHLRKDAKWSDGTRLTAKDFLFSYERMLHPDFAAKYSEMLYFIAGAEEFNKGEIKDFEKVGVKAINDTILQFKLKSPTPFLLDLTLHCTWFPVPKQSILKHGSMTTKSSSWTDPKNIVSNGAFKLKSWKFNQFIEVSPNTHYWDSKKVKLKGIKFLPISNPYTEARMFFDGQLHGTFTLAPEMIQYSKENYPKNIRQEPYLNSYFLRCNVLSPPLKKKNVRKALALATDTESLIKNLLKGGQTSAYALTPVMGDYQPPQAVFYNIEKAKELLALEGYTRSNPLRLKFVTANIETNKRLAEAIQSMWKQHLGVETTIQQFENKTFHDKVHKSEYDVVFGGWIGDYPDPSTYLDMWVKGGGNNRTNWSNPKYEKLLAEARVCNSSSLRLNMLSQAESILLDEAPILPLYWATTNYLMSPSVKNWHPLLLNFHPYKFVDLTNE